MSDDINLKVMEEILDGEVTFYTDRINPVEVYVEYPLKNGALAFERSDSTMFNAFLGYRYRAKTSERVVPDFAELICIKEQDAQFEQINAVTINRRVAGSISVGHIAYFLADETWTTVQVKAGKWTVGRSKKLKFTRASMNEAQVMPKSGGNLLVLLRKYVNMSDEDFILFAVYMVQGFSRSSSHFAAILSSGKGTGKSTLSKLLRAVIDPSAAGASLIPTNEGDLKNLLGNSYMVVFDNTAALPGKVSNILCAAITGTKDAKRTYYTTCDQTILNLHNLVVINGIDIVPYKSDLAERSLLFELQPISRDKRKTDADFWNDFEADRPAILGAIFDTLAKAIELLPEVKDRGLHRMADANLEMLAIAAALGIPKEEFQRILLDNGRKLIAVYTENNPFVDAVVSYVRLKGNIDAPGAQVWGEMLNATPGSTKGFPDSASALSRRLNEEKEALEEAGIIFSRRKKNDANYICLKKVPKSQQTMAQKNAIARRQQLLSDASTAD